MATQWLKKSVFEFGEQKVTQFKIFENKKWFSVILFYFHKCPNKVQDRFHTHAFNSISILLWGDYEEEFLNSPSKMRSRSRFLYIPRNSFHRITRSNGCCTLLISGKWCETWVEFKDGVYTEYFHNRLIKKQWIGK